jgi:hypothetical protein
VIGHVELFLQEARGIMRFIAHLVLSVSISCIAVAGAQSQELIGRWEHRFHGDSEGEVLVIRLDNGIIKGEYLGLERAGEHGLFYFATEARILM